MYAISQALSVDSPDECNDRKCRLSDRLIGAQLSANSHSSFRLGLRGSFGPKGRLCPKAWSQGKTSYLADSSRAEGRRFRQYWSGSIFGKTDFAKAHVVSVLLFRCGGQCDGGGVQQRQPLLLGLVLCTEERGEVFVHGCAAAAAAHALAVPGHAKRPLPLCLGKSHESGVSV